MLKSIDSVSLVYGKINLPHVGHERLVAYARELSDMTYVITTAATSPMSQISKETALNWSFSDPNTKCHILDDREGLYDAIKTLKSFGRWDVLNLVCGADRAPEYTKRLKDFGHEFFRTINIHKQIRSMDAYSGGISSSYMRNLARSNNYTEFRRFLPFGLKKKERHMDLWKRHSLYIEDMIEVTCLETMSLEAT